MTQALNRSSTVRSEGGLLPRDLLDRIAAGRNGLSGLEPGHYHLAPGERLGEAISRSWNRLLGVWASFQDELYQLPDSERTATRLTRSRWSQHLFQELGYGQLQASRPVEIEEKPYPVSHGWGPVPIHLVGARVDINRSTAGLAGAARMSPHGLVQELLNRSPDRLWGIVSNGLSLRLLRDNAALTRQAFVEFDVEGIFEGQEYADFALLWMVCHQSRVEGDAPEECWLEQWRAEAATHGTRALDQLRASVEAALASLGEGFIAHPDNGRLRARLERGRLDRQDYYRQLLRLVYRLLFLLVTEHRDVLLHGDDAEAKQRYRRYYSISRLQQLADAHRGGRYSDLWHQLRVVFDGLGDRDGIPALGLPGLGSFLWSEQATPDLDSAELANSYLLDALRALSQVRDGGVVRKVDYRNLGSEELGSVYESLLELHPEISLAHRSFGLSRAAGNDRKTSGSYYTPTPLINELLDSALEPVLDRAARAADPEEAILGLRVLDPACGSGHFLVAAAHRMARRLAMVRSGEPEPAPDDLQHALRDVVASCLHGIDLNEMAVELCKVTLWLEAVEPGRPLAFLDHRIRHGNALLGTTPRLLEEGIPDDAFMGLTGDDRKVVTELKARNKQERKGQQTLLFGPASPAVDAVAQAHAEIDALPDGKLAEVEAKEQRWRDLLASPEYEQAALAADAWCAAFVAPKRVDGPGITTGFVRQAQENPVGQLEEATVKAVEELSKEYRFLHLHLTFPEVFRRPAEGTEPDNPHMGWSGGFDIVLGNPPFLNQLKSKTATSKQVVSLLSFTLPNVVKPYTDVSAVFFATAANLTTPTGYIGLVQPTSLLASRDAGGARKYVTERGALTSIWVATTHMFSASVYVCFATISMGKVQGHIHRLIGPHFERLSNYNASNDDLTSAPWSRYLPEAFGFPNIQVRGDKKLKDVCSATADFRDQYYGLIPYVSEKDDSDSGKSTYAKLATTGLIDPAVIMWGEKPAKFAKTMWSAPRVDIDMLQQTSELGDWADARLVPKILLATQGRVLEAAVDRTGDYIPVVPVITVTTTSGYLWRAAAVLLSPPATAWAGAEFAGTALTASTIKPNAKGILELPLPTDETKWDEASSYIKKATEATNSDERIAHLIQAAERMCEAYRTSSDLLEWWSQRLIGNSTRSSN